MSAKRFGVLPYFRLAGKTNLVLVTSRTNQNWIFPKGRKVSGKSGPDSAIQEAFEEAGLVGRIDGKTVIRVKIERRGKKYQLMLYPMRVEKLLKRWPESKRRKRIHVSSRKARKMINCSGMRRSLVIWKKYY